MPNTENGELVIKGNAYFAFLFHPNTKYVKKVDDKARYEMKLGNLDTDTVALLKSMNIAVWDEGTSKLAEAEPFTIVSQNNFQPKVIDSRGNPITEDNLRAANGGASPFLGNGSRVAVKGLVALPENQPKHVVAKRVDERKRGDKR